ncbi:RING-H2 finger protein ATL16 [Abeliophyllum distichum]|uniref:RING-H2 finger protein ATL16 n=1 Tax=Abeliophyllum distichum TaxID=126358 RepID=A0ABD1UIM9_9LAMI
MGLLYYAIRLPKAMTLTFFLNILSQLRFLVIGALTRLGLYKPAPEEERGSDNSNNYILILDGISPSLVPVPVHVVTAAIKKRVSVVKLEDFLVNKKGEEENGRKGMHNLLRVY